jgi:RimJ/RimL family protein N-acetyltransferase
MIEIPRDVDTELETEHLFLSPMYATDSELLFELLKEPALHTFTGNETPSSVQELRKRLILWEQRRSPNGDEIWLNWTLRRKADGTVIGYVQVSMKTSQGQIAWLIGLPFQKQGYATEATCRVMAWLKERIKSGEIRANIHPNHVASQAVARRLGLCLSSECTADGEEAWILSF